MIVTAFTHLLNLFRDNEDVTQSTSAPSPKPKTLATALTLPKKTVAPVSVPTRALVPQRKRGPAFVVSLKRVIFISNQGKRLSGKIAAVSNGGIWIKRGGDVFNRPVVKTLN